MGIKTIIPDMMIDNIVANVISEECIKINATRNIHSKAIKPICIGVSLFRPI